MCITIFLSQSHFFNVSKPLLTFRSNLNSANTVSSEPCSLKCTCHSFSCNIVKLPYILETVSEDLYRSANNFCRYLKFSQLGLLSVSGRQSCAVLASFVPQEVNHKAKVKRKEATHSRTTLTFSQFQNTQKCIIIRKASYVCDQLHKLSFKNVVPLSVNMNWGVSWSSLQGIGIQRSPCIRGISYTEVINFAV